MEELKILILCIENEFEKISEEWEKSHFYEKLNLGKKLVCDLYNNPKLLATILRYRSFILTSTFNPSILFSDLNLKSGVFSRIKAINSIQYKIESYYHSRENGKIPINKCLNDIVGIRIILNNEVSLIAIGNWIKSTFENLKVIKAYRGEYGEYKAIHVYFGKGNNHLFQWELQIWLLKDSNKNLLSHHKYKQNYIKWEKEH